MALPAQPELSEAWREICTALRRTVGESTFEIWFDSLEVRERTGQVLVVQAPPTKRNWIAARYGRVLQRCAAGVLGDRIQVELVTSAAAGRAHHDDPHPAPGRELEPRFTFNPRHTFAQFVIGDGNRLAHAASLAAAENPGQAYNPLFLHAPPGLGKTHLLNAIGNYVSAFSAGASVRYTTVESFTNHFISALSSRSVNSFKRAYRDADVLLIDDVQFLAAKAKTEEEFFHTFNSVYETGRQLVLTCDRLPHELVSVEERLRERFESGLVADIKPPDFATRLTILRKRANLDRVPLADPSVLEFLAERITGNVRTLEGTLIRLVAHHSLTGRPINLELAASVVGTITHEDCRTPTVERVQTKVAEHFDISVPDMVSASRAARVAWPRQVAMYLARELTHASLGGIGSAFGGRNHTTIHYACARVSDRMTVDPTVADTLEELEHTITADERDRSS